MPARKTTVTGKAKSKSAKPKRKPGKGKRKPIKPKPKPKPKPPKPRRPKPKPPKPDTPGQPRPGPKPLRPRRKKRIGELEAYLKANPMIANAIKWHGQSSPSLAWEVYPNWSAAQKGELARVYYQIRRVYRKSRVPVFPGLSATPPFAALDADGMGTYYDHSVAWSYFLAYVAHSLVVEILGLVPWSIKNLPWQQQDRMLTSYGLFQYSLGPRYFLEEANTPGDPVRLFAFLTANGCIRPTRRETIGAVLDWCRSNMRHFRDTYSPATALDHWQYNGWPPVERVIAGTTHPQYGFAHWTAGCGGTTGFLCVLLRTANIAVLPAYGDGHVLPYFMEDDLYLSHGDDPYSRMLNTVPTIPIDKLFIDATTYGTWFGQNVPPATQVNNVGRRTKELALEYLTDWILRLRCQDIAQGITDHSLSKVYTETNLRLFNYYTVAELEAMNLWTNLDAKIAAMGGCANIPP